MKTFDPDKRECIIKKLNEFIEDAKNIQEIIDMERRHTSTIDSAPEDE